MAREEKHLSDTSVTQEKITFTCWHVPCRWWDQSERFGDRLVAQAVSPMVIDVKDPSAVPIDDRAPWQGAKSLP